MTSASPAQLATSRSAMIIRSLPATLDPRALHIFVNVDHPTVLDANEDRRGDDLVRLSRYMDDGVEALRDEVVGRDAIVDLEAQCRELAHVADIVDDVALALNLVVEAVPDLGVVGVERLDPLMIQRLHRGE